MARLTHPGQKIRKDDARLDEPGILAVIKMFRTCLVEVREHPDDVGRILKVGVDLGVYVEGRRIFDVEVEMRKNWGAGAFPFPDVDVPVRKARRRYQRPTYFASVRFDGERLLIAPQAALRPGKMVVNRRGGDRPEPFYHYFVKDGAHFDVTLAEPAQCQACVAHLLAENGVDVQNTWSEFLVFGRKA
jgi:hypothetical protein